MANKNNVYIGNRYVPVFADPVEWDNLRIYEPLTIVTYQGTSYTSKKAVPAGIALSNTEYWVATGNYNAQVEQYRQEVATLSGEVTTLSGDVTNLSGDVTKLSGDITALNAKNNISNKKILIIGDSISDSNILANNWAVQIKNKLEADNNMVTISGISGASVSGGEGVASLSTRFNATSKDFDIVIVQLGVNDWILNHTLGDMAGDLTLFDNALTSLTNEPEVYWILPFDNRDPRTTLHPLWLDIYRAYLSQVCRVYGWSIIDGADVPNLSIFTEASENKYFLNDTYHLHPNEAGSALIADYVFKKMTFGCDSGIRDFVTVASLSSYVATGTTLRFANIIWHSDMSAEITIEGYTTLDASAEANILNKIDFLSYIPDNKGSVYGNFNMYDTRMESAPCTCSWIPSIGLKISSMKTSLASQVVSFSGSFTITANPYYNTYGKN